MPEKTRPFRIVDGDCFITLADGTETIVDAVRASEVVDHCWGYWPTSRTVRRLVQVNKQRTSVHIADVINPPPVGMINDHRDGNGRNNRFSNLRFATRSQNCMNRKSNVSKQGFKGVSSLGNKYRARVAVNGKTFYLGVFADPKQAALAYDEAARKFHGEFACLNFPTETERQA